MYLEVYPDVIFALNFFMDFVLLFLLKKVNRKKSSLKRLFPAAALGGTAAAIAGCFPWMNGIIRFLFMNICTSVLMLLIAFGKLKKTDLMKQVITLYLITYFLGGLMNSVYYNTSFRLNLIKFGNSLIFSNISWKFVIIIVLSVIPITLLTLLILRWYRSNIRETLDTELILKEQRLRDKGLVDTGNCLYDPLFGKPVIIIEEMLLENLLSAEAYQEFLKVKSGISERGSCLEECSTDNEEMLHYRIIPYQSVGKPKGLMIGLVLDKVVIFKGKETICNEKVTAAVCDNHLSTKEEYHVILHKELL